MTPFVTETGSVRRLQRDNIDTDQLIPARFMSRSRSEGYGDYLFHDLRRDDTGRLLPDFPLNGVGPAPFLLTGDNFGCGSSREAAVYVLQDAGFRAVLATGFADIFRNNAMKNGLVPVELSAADHAELWTALDAEPSICIQVDLLGQLVSAGELSLNFAIPPASRELILRGLDEISSTMLHINRIREFELSHASLSGPSRAETSQRMQLEKDVDP